jgi:tRNA (cytidine/uridine-2'-O-)-methyltransferase
VREREEFLAALPPGAFHLLTVHATTPYVDIPVCRGDYLIFGKETTGLPKAWLARYPAQCYTIPMAEPGVRSLNLSSAVAIVVYDALRRVRPP